MKAKKCSDKVSEMQDEYDFSGAVRGKYAKECAAGTNIVVLDPDVARVFPDSVAVNETLRSLLPIVRRLRVPLLPAKG